MTHNGAESLPFAPRPRPMMCLASLAMAFMVSQPPPATAERVRALRDTSAAGDHTLDSSTRVRPLPYRAGASCDAEIVSRSGFTGSPEAVARPRFPQNVACGFPALRCSEDGSQHCESL